MTARRTQAVRTVAPSGGRHKHPRHANYGRPARADLCGWCAGEGCSACRQTGYLR